MRQDAGKSVIPSSLLYSRLTKTNQREPLLKTVLRQSLASQLNPLPMLTKDGDPRPVLMRSTWAAVGPTTLTLSTT